MEHIDIVNLYPSNVLWAFRWSLRGESFNKDYRELRDLVRFSETDSSDVL